MEEEEEVGMKEKHKKQLQKYHRNLVHDIQVPVISSRLIQSNVLNSILIDEIMSKTTRQGQVEALLDTLPRRGPKAFENFCEALQADYEWLAGKLRSVDVGETKENTTKDNNLKHQNTPDLLQHGPASPMKKLSIQKQVQQPTDKGVGKVVSVTEHSVSGIASEVHVQFPVPQENATLVITDSEGKTMKYSLDNIKDNKCTTKIRPKSAGKHLVRVVNKDNVEVPGGKCEFNVDNNNPVWKLGSRGSGPGQFNNPRGVALDRDGNIYVADSVNFRIVKINSSGQYVSHFALVKGEENKKNRVNEIAINNKELEIICIKGYDDDENEPWGHTIQIYNMQGEFKHEYVNTDMKKARNVTVNSRGQIIVSDWEVHAIFIGSRQGEHIQWERVGKKGQGPGELLGPIGITTGPADDIVVCDGSNIRVQVLDSNGLYKNHFGGNGQELGKFLFPVSVVMDEDNNILVSDWVKNVIQVFSYDGSFISCIDSEGDKLNHPHGLAVTGDGHVIVPDQWNHCIKKYRYK